MPQFRNVIHPQPELYMLRRFIKIILLMILSFPAGPSIAGDQGSSDPLEKIARQALQDNEDLKAAEARWRMFERKIVPAGSLDDPTLSLGLVNYPVDSFEDDVTPMTGKDIKISQKFPFPGKLSTKTEIAEQQALWYRGVYKDARFQVVRKVKDAYYRLFFVEKATEITEKNIKLLDEFIRLTETRYEVGEGLQQDVLKAQVERSKLMDKLFSFRQRRQSALADLNALLARPTSTPFEAPEKVELTEVDRNLEQLQVDSRSKRPLYAAYDSLIERYKSQRRLAELDYRPDVTFWAGYRIREDSPMDPVDGEDFVSAGVSINLPIYLDKREEEVAAADTGMGMARRQYAEFRHKVDSAIHDAYARLERKREQAALYRSGIIPQAQQSFQSAMSAYRVGKVDFLSLLDSLLTLYRYEMDYYRVLADHERSIARLEAQAGLDLMGVIENKRNDGQLSFE